MIRKSTRMLRSYFHLFFGPAFRLTSRFPEAFEICKEFRIGREKMLQIANALTKEIQLGLARETHPQAIVKCFLTYIQDLPTGRERGKFMALDLGGTNFRCLLVNLTDGAVMQSTLKSFAISEELMQGPGTDLFDFIAECLAGFCKEQNIGNDRIPLGFTFSFPLQQIGINKGILRRWTKGFRCEGVEGKDVVELLQSAIDRRGDVNVKIVAILNDSTSTLVSCAYSHPDCRIGLIVGTGVNACYVEQTSKAEMLDGYESSQKPIMIINTELGAFGDNGSLDSVRTVYDKTLDIESVNPGSQTLEKCVSGMYLGEVVRHILLDLMRMGVLFRGMRPDEMQTKWIFRTRFISEIESDPPEVFHNARVVLYHLGIKTDDLNDMACLRYICDSISLRSAQLTSCAIVAMINQMNVESCTVAIDGGLCRYHPHYRNLIEQQMSILLKNASAYKIVLSEDGSGLGAALVAAAFANK
ncbi:hexokinase type 2-like [Drosophila albomicans]|uniref:Phosphotransferase n=1 Tax=Drosophila albomicans TaxID=7291 RepID=A0A6P8XF32_DROAB|nr:hexokinase type 2-like [Drosophila albomicans]